MKKVGDTSAGLPTDLTGLRAALIRLLGPVVTAINQAAEGRIWAHAYVAATNTAGIGTTVILVAPTGAMAQTLPDASDMVGSVVIVKRANATTHVVTVDAVSGDLDGAASDTLTTAWQSKGWYSDGSNYFRVI